MARVRIEVPIEQKATPADTQTAAPHQAPSGGDVAISHDKQGLTFKRIAIGLVIIVLFIFVANLIQDKSRLEQQLQENKGSSEQDVNAIVERLAKSVELPNDETPQMRTIEDASKFKQQSQVLSDIQDGDVWLFYPKAGKQVFYRPKTQKVIFVVPFASETPAQGAQ